jgi:hypothetical protein
MRVFAKAGSPFAWYMRLPVATLIAQYPEVQRLDPHEELEDVRKDRIPCILPQVVFINCSILAASVFERGEANWLCATVGDRLFPGDFRWRVTA